MPIDIEFDETNYLSIIPRFGGDDVNTVPHVYINEYNNSYHDFAEYCIIQRNECSQRRIQSAWENIQPTTYTYPKSCRHIQLVYDPTTLKVTEVIFHETASTKYTGTRTGIIHDYPYCVATSTSISATTVSNNL
jgi:hypothetical protein